MAAEQQSTCTNQDLMVAVLKLQEEVKRMGNLLDNQKERKEYHKAYYQRRKADALAKAEAEKALAARLDNLNRHCLDGRRDNRLPVQVWTEKLKVFASRGLSAYNFISWLAWSWNHNTYKHVPITKSGGYMHVFIGLSGDKPLRSKYSERDVTGHMRIARLTSVQQVDTLADALFWKWTFRTVANVVSEAEDEPWWEQLGERWHKPLKVAMGEFGLYEVHGHMWNPAERDLQVASDVYARLRPTLEMNWGAFLRGLFSKEEPFSQPT
jgi:hypothetical protein